MADETELFHNIVRAVTNVPDGKLAEAVAKVRALLEADDAEPEDEAEEEEEGEEPAPKRKTKASTTKNRLQRGGKDRRW